mgnify:CR=1 FL=1
MIDHSYSDQVLELSFTRLAKKRGSFSNPPRSLSDYVSELINNPDTVFLYDKTCLFASASIDMWERAIHSFLWSVAITKQSPIWSSTLGYYSSHYSMRAFAHAFGFFKSFVEGKAVQITIEKSQPAFKILQEKNKGEHPFYWKVVKEYPEFSKHPLFKLNGDRDPSSESAHRNHANYADNLNNFRKFDLPKEEEFEKHISSVTSKRISETELIIHRDKFPINLINVQILAYQRIVTFRDFLDRHISKNQFWMVRKTPSWCKLDFNIEDELSSIARESLVSKSITREFFS